MDKKINIKIKPIGLLDLIAFTKLVPNRKKKFSDAPDTPVDGAPAANRLAALLHPKEQKMVVKEVKQETPRVKTYTLVPAGGGKPAYFRAGQYISVKGKIGDLLINRPYSLSSSPKEATEGCYRITVKENDEGFFSKWIIDNWKEGLEVSVSAPEGNFYYEPLRDAKTVVGLCGGSGITPFYSMAKAVCDNDEDFNLVLLYGCVKECEIIFKEELEALEKKSGGKVKVVYVLSGEQKEGYEQGFISADIIKKYAPKKDKYSVFICGPQAMYEFAMKELKKLKLEKKYIRQELFGAVKMIEKVKGYPEAAFGKVFKLTVNTYQGNQTVDARADEPVLVALERAGIAAPAKCRSGECGYCRSKLLSGEVFIPDDNKRRLSDKKFGFIHICDAYPISDLTIEIPV